MLVLTALPKARSLRLLVAAGILLAASAGSRAVAAPAPLAQVPETRLARFARSLNVWLNFGYSLDGLSLPREPIIAADVQQMQADGFTHFRVFLFAEQWLSRYATAAEIQANFAQLDADLDVWLAQGMAVTLTLGSMNPADAGDLLGTETGRTEVASFWSTVATRYADRDPELLSFELYNEPNSITGTMAGDCAYSKCEPPIWRDYQAAFLAAIRAAAPTNTVLVTSSRFSVFDALIGFEPYTDGNLLYVFHYYYPNVFSFQSKPPYTEVSGLPWPACMDGAQAAVDAIVDPSIKQSAQDYVDENWQARTIQADIMQVAEWGSQHGVPLFADEFGAFGQEQGSRDRYIRDVRMALESSGIGWSVWSASDVYTNSWLPGQRVPVESMMSALGRQAWNEPPPACVPEAGAALGELAALAGLAGLVRHRRKATRSPQH
jgi:aryl-phospho-beta-D-glucosidase BglC (GH1 family)